MPISDCYVTTWLGTFLHDFAVLNIANFQVLTFIRLLLLATWGVSSIYDFENVVIRAEVAILKAKISEKN